MRDKGLATAVATLLAAFATAHLMQFGLSAGRAISGEPLSAPIGLATMVAWRGSAAPAELPDTPSTGPEPLAEVLNLPDARLPPRDAAIPAALGAAREGGFGLSCERRLTLLPLPGALVEARLDAPCDQGVRVELGHAGLRFAIAIGDDGHAASQIPALTPEMGVEAAFADGTVLSARVTVPDATEMERVALVADGWAGLTLRALESLSWRGVATPDAAAGHGGDIVQFGDPGIEAPLLAQVYTAPVGRFGSLGASSLQVEASITPSNCARDVGAEIIRSSGGVPPTPVALQLSLPACDAEGGLLVIDLPSPGLRMARN